MEKIDIRQKEWKEENECASFFYLLEKSIHSYRDYAQQHFAREFGDFTLDQLLVMKMVYDNPGFTQQQIAESVFLDRAAITRIIRTLVIKGLIFRTNHQEDSRQSELILSPSAEELIEAVLPRAIENRQQALRGITQVNLDILKDLLNRVIGNCGGDNEPVIPGQ
ncbi:MarR family winged helix-turn-helix transcriptional regulator [Flavihumibacter stibioxidans]|uniref:HTH marR-type domain-containing protein n=1 Tax=Flavihumibacter stibioxidans TaxID=1834163 RepID=A0ABR7M4G6_9BACT|nr:MarR family transcriptional regulator [Flavihumibacter stibioxidans]MBC6489905.1 hypothetical protein [Flavihumibacter stibioxidans]